MRRDGLAGAPARQRPSADRVVVDQVLLDLAGDRISLAEGYFACYVDDQRNYFARRTFYYAPPTLWLPLAGAQHSRTNGRCQSNAFMVRHIYSRFEGWGHSPEYDCGNGSRPRGSFQRRVSLQCQ